MINDYCSIPGHFRPTCLRETSISLQLIEGWVSEKNNFKFTFSLPGAPKETHFEWPPVNPVSLVQLWELWGCDWLGFSNMSLSVEIWHLSVECIKTTAMSPPCESGNLLLVLQTDGSEYYDDHSIHSGLLSSGFHQLTRLPGPLVEQNWHLWLLRKRRFSPVCNLPSESEWGSLLPLMVYLC